MDGLAARLELGTSSVLLFGARRKKLLAEMARRVDFLRPCAALFFPSPGSYSFRVGYSQGSWVEPHSTSPVTTTAPPLRFVVDGPL
jgi:hypothetical protein